MTKEQMTKGTCAWCSGKKGQAYMLAKGLGDWQSICRRCYTRRMNNPLMEFKPLEAK